MEKWIRNLKLREKYFLSTNRVQYYLSKFKVRSKITFLTIILIKRVQNAHKKEE